MAAGNDNCCDCIFTVCTLTLININVHILKHQNIKRFSTPFQTRSACVNFFTFVLPKFFRRCRKGFTNILWISRIIKGATYPP